jgi:serine/threonine protein kinase
MRDSIERHSRRALNEVVKGLDDDGLDLLSRMIVCIPGQRISAADALNHRYFASLSVQN